jgi:hypothetical protein
VYHRNNILLVRPGGKFGNNTPVFLMDFLRGHHVAPSTTVAKYGRCRVVTGRFYGKDINILVFHLFGIKIESNKGKTIKPYQKI